MSTRRQVPSSRLRRGHLPPCRASTCIRAPPPGTASASDRQGLKPGRKPRRCKGSGAACAALASRPTASPLGGAGQQTPPDTVHRTTLHACCAACQGQSLPGGHAVPPLWRGGAPLPVGIVSAQHTARRGRHGPFGRGHRRQGLSSRSGASPHPPARLSTHRPCAPVECQQTRQAITCVLAWRAAIG